MSNEAAPEGGALAELRHVAVLFADLQGFTHLCERLDPEEVVEILDALYDRLGAEAERYGGYIDKVLGDGLMVLFGAPQAHEDDGLRAVMAGLAMQKAMDELQPWIREKLGQSLGIRIGIDAGPVVYGKVGPGSRVQPTVIGDAANVAARLQRIAAPGQVVISDRGRRLAARQIQFRKIGLVQLQGRNAEVVAYAAVAPFASAGGAAQSTPLVGRSDELKRLMTVYTMAVSGKTGLVLLTGEAGIGKTRLLSEFLGILQAMDAKQRPVVVHVRNRWDVGNVYRPYDSMVGAIGARARQVLEGANGDAPPAGLKARALLFGGTKTAASMLRDICERLPAVIIVDDWQWATNEDGERIVQVIGEAAGLPVLFVISGRRADLVPQASIAEAGIRDITVHRLRLAPLGRNDSWLLLQQHPAFSALPLDVAESLLDRAGGNPAHVLECIDSLIDQGLLAPSGDGWRAVQDRGALLVPEMLRNDILSHLDSLGPSERDFLRLCAVIGLQFSVAMLAKVMAIAEAEVRSHLGALVEAGLLVAMDASTETYSFRSGLVREVTYDTMLKRHRRQLHLRVGEILEASGEADSADLVVHFVRAGVAEKAVPYGLAAGETLLQQGDHDRALALLSELEPLLSEGDTEHSVVLLERLGEALVCSGNCAAGLDRLLRALSLVRDPASRGRLMAQVGWAYAIQGRAEMAVKHYQRAQEALSGAGELQQQMLVAASMRWLYDRP